MKSGNLNFLEPSGPFQACNGTALPLLLSLHFSFVCVCVCQTVKDNGLMYQILHTDTIGLNSKTVNNLNKKRKLVRLCRSLPNYKNTGPIHVIWHLELSSSHGTSDNTVPLWQCRFSRKTVSPTCCHVQKLRHYSAVRWPWEAAAQEVNSIAGNEPYFDVHRAVHHNIISIVKPTRCTNVSNLFYFGMTTHMFRTVFLSTTSSSRLYIQLSNSYCCLLARKQTAVSVWQMPVAVCTVSNSWWWTERPSEICRVSFRNKIWYIYKR